MALAVLTGASGSGKTAIARTIATRYPGIRVFHLDDIGVPSLEEMTRQFGSPEAWQRSALITWMARLAPLLHDGADIVFEGQAHLAFVSEAARAAGVTDHFAVLVDCNDAVRTRRLVVDRGQPELAGPEMMGWAAYLRREAEVAQCTTLDTSDRTLDDCADAIRTLLEKARQAG